MVDDDIDLEEARSRLIKLMEDAIDPQIAKSIEIANNSIDQKQEPLELTISAKGAANA